MAASELRYAAAAIQNAARLVTESESGSGGAGREERLANWQDALRKTHASVEKIATSLEAGVKDLDDPGS